MIKTLVYYQGGKEATFCATDITVGNDSLMLSFGDRESPDRGIIDIPLESVYAALKEADEKRRT